MRIIGGKDYYDSGLAYGQDSDVVFVRDGRTISDDQCPLWNGYKHDIVKGIWQRGHRLSIHSIADDKNLEAYIFPVSAYVAGKHYGGIKLMDAKTYQKIRVFWDYDQFEELVESLGRTIVVPDPRRDRWMFRAINSPFADLRSFLTPRPATAEQMDWLVQNRVAVAIWCDTRTYGHSPSDWYCNPGDKHWSLAAYDFHRVMDPYTLFQELSMFVGGVLPRNPNPMVEITDDRIKVAKHGFDDWSFRKHKDDG